MPKRFRKKGGKRRFRRKAKGGRKRKMRPSTSVQRSLIIADRQFVKMTYTQLVNVSGAAVIYNVWRGNSVFDPDQTGTGGQPLGYDQWANFYDRYRVYGSQMTIKTLSSAATAQLYVTIIPTLVATDYVGFSAAADMSVPYHRQGMLAGTFKPCRVTNRMTTKKIMGLNKGEVGSDPDLSALTGANPATQWYWLGKWSFFDGSTSIPTTSYAIVSVTYFVEFNDRRVLGASSDDRKVIPRGPSVTYRSGDKISADYAEWVRWLREDGHTGDIPNVTPPSPTSWTPVHHPPPTRPQAANTSRSISTGRL